MGPRIVSLVLIVVLGMTVTLHGPTMAHAVESNAPAEDTTSIKTTREGHDSQCEEKTAPLQRRQDLTDTRLNGLDSHLRTQLIGLDTRLNERDTRQNEFDTRLNRIDGRLDGIETAISDMKEYLQEWMENMDKKVDWALTGKARHDGTVRKKSKVYGGCQEALAHGETCSGIYKISPDCENYMEVYCEQRLDGGGWTVFQVRNNGSVDFYQDWNTYRTGFGDLRGEFWLGNEYIHQLSKYNDQQLKIELVSPDGEVKYADYSQFSVANEFQKYMLEATGYSGGIPPGNSMAAHNGKKFSTMDQDNDRHSGSCAQDRHAGWWYDACQNANLNGPYGSSVRYKGLNWYKWKGGSVSLRATRMMMRKRP